MNWNYTKEISRMGDISHTLTNESLDLPLSGNHKTPEIRITKNRFGFKIELFLGGIVLNRSSNEYRVRFDDKKPEMTKLNYSIDNLNYISICNDIMFKFKESKTILIELDTKLNGLQYYEFNIEGLENICEENNIFSFKRKIYEPYVPTENNDNYLPHIIISIIVLICFIIWICASNKENSITSQHAIENRDGGFISSTDYKNREIKIIEKKEPIKKTKTKIKKEESENIESTIINTEYPTTNYVEDKYKTNNVPTYAAVSHETNEKDYYLTKLEENLKIYKDKYNDLSNEYFKLFNKGNKRGLFSFIGKGKIIRKENEVQEEMTTIRLKIEEIEKKIHKENYKDYIEYAKSVYN